MNLVFTDLTTHIDFYSKSEEYINLVNKVIFIELVTTKRTFIEGKLYTKRFEKYLFQGDSKMPFHRWNAIYKYSLWKYYGFESKKSVYNLNLHHIDGNIYNNIFINLIFLSLADHNKIHNDENNELFNSNPIKLLRVVLSESKETYAKNYLLHFKNFFIMKK